MVAPFAAVSTAGPPSAGASTIELVITVSLKFLKVCNSVSIQFMQEVHSVLHLAATLCCFSKFHCAAPGNTCICRSVNASDAPHDDSVERFSVVWLILVSHQHQAILVLCWAYFAATAAMDCAIPLEPMFCYAGIPGLHVHAGPAQLVPGFSMGQATLAVVASGKQLQDTLQICPASVPKCIFGHLSLFCRPGLRRNVLFNYWTYCS